MFLDCPWETIIPRRSSPRPWPRPPTQVQRTKTTTRLRSERTERWPRTPAPSPRTPDTIMCRARPSRPRPQRQPTPMLPPSRPPVIYTAALPAPAAAVCPAAADIPAAAAAPPAPAACCPRPDAATGRPVDHCGRGNPHEPWVPPIACGGKGGRRPRRARRGKETHPRSCMKLQMGHATSLRLCSESGMTGCWRVTRPSQHWSRSVPGAPRLR